MSGTRKPLYKSSSSHFESYSQAGQDRFVWEMFQHRPSGLFFDVGSGHAFEYSNTWGLERIGWEGFLFDRFHYRKDPSCSNFERNRSCMMEGNAVEKLKEVPVATGVVDYMSIDIDGDSVKALGAALELGLSFRIITIEHDWYVRGRDLRDQEREMLTRAGYDLVCADVSWGQGPYEDWWADPIYFPQENRDKFRCRGRWWRDIPHIMDSL